MRTDYIADFNGTTETYRTRIDEMIAMKKVELQRLEKLRAYVDGVACVEQMVADPTLNGDREALPSVARPIETAEQPAERRNGRPVMPAQPDQAAA